MLALARNENSKGLQNIAVIIATSISLLACSMPTTVVLGNASNRVSIISYKDDSHKVAELTLLPEAALEITHLLDVHFSIRTSESIENYERAAVPESFIQNVGFGPFLRRTVKAQLENDKCIYLVKTDIVPNSGHPVQPAGFPLCPLSPSK